MLAFGIICILMLCGIFGFGIRYYIVTLKSKGENKVQNIEVIPEKKSKYSTMKPGAKKAAPIEIEKK